MAFVNWFDYSSAVRGYHNYRSCWQPPPELKLVCSHDKNNPYDFFPSKVVVAESGMVVCHLPMEHSHVTKYTLDRKARHPNFYELLCIATDPRRFVNTMSHWNSYASNCKKKRTNENIRNVYWHSLLPARGDPHCGVLYWWGQRNWEKWWRPSVIKRHNQNKVKTRKLMLIHQERSELFLKNVAQYLVRKQVFPKTW